jgi:signal transduction histidine kinase
MAAREARVGDGIDQARGAGGEDLELKELRRAVSDLVAVTALPGLWLGQTVQFLAESLSGALAGSLAPALLYLRLHLCGEGRPVEIVRGARGQEDDERAHGVGEFLAPWLQPIGSSVPVIAANPLGDGTLRLVVTPISHGKTYGLAAVGSERPDFPTEHGRLILRVAANEAAIFLHGAQLSAERAELLAREQAARFEAERAWAAAEAERRQLTVERSQLETALHENIRLAEEARGKAALEERQRLARELHDSVSQALYGIALNAGAAEIALEADPRQLTRLLGEVSSLAEAGLAEMRALILELRPESLQQEGLVAALEKQAAAASARHGLEIGRALDREPTLPLPAKEALYRIAQEALQNTAKHGRARSAQVELAQTADEVTLSVADDGQGFDPTAEFPGHLGLRSMRERAEAIGGSLSIDSGPGRGTRIEVRMPLVPSAC